jgi:hypothetical protein
VTPYEGPLYLGPEDAANATERRTGAAGRVVHCETTVVGEFRPGRYEGGETGRTPEAGLRTGWEEGAFSGPEKGYLLERREGERALFTIRVDGEVKMAVILLDGPALGAPSGWHPESWARCNPSEFPDSVIWDPGLEIWTDDTGNRVPTYRVVSSQGPEHCSWTGMRFLTIDENDRAYVRAPDRELLKDYFAEDFQASVKLPPDVIDTGFNRGVEHLWLSADRERAYVGVNGVPTVELWPRTTQPLACA